MYIHASHIAALLSSSVTFGLIIWSRRWDGEVGVLCVFCWTFSFFGSLLNVLIEIFTFHQGVRPIFWCNIPMTISSYAALFCLNATIIFPNYFIKGQEDNEFYGYCIVAEVFSCIATLAHLVEVWIMCIESKCYMATGSGLLQVSQTYVASAIFFFLADTMSFKDHPGVIWSLAVYCLCFIGTFVNIICCAFHNKHNQIWLKGFNLIAVVMYPSAFWPVFQLSQDLRQISCPGSCQDDLGLWPETRLIAVAALTALNFLLYTLSFCCILRSNEEKAKEEEEHSRSSSTSDSCPTQMSDETRAVLPVSWSRALLQHNTTCNVHCLSRNDIWVQRNSNNFFIKGDVHVHVHP